MCKGGTPSIVVPGEASAREIEDHRPQADFTRVNGALGDVAWRALAQASGDLEMSARKRIRAVQCMDCEAVLTAEDDAALADALGKHYIGVHRTLLMTEDRIREQIDAQARDA